MIEQLRNSNNLALALISDNDEVKKYIAKTVAYLSLRNGKGKARSLERADKSNILIPGR